MYKTATTILTEKKARLALGDEAVKLQVGEGRDIMSILSELILFRLVNLVQGQGLIARYSEGEHEGGYQGSAA